MAISSSNQAAANAGNRVKLLPYLLGGVLAALILVAVIIYKISPPQWGSYREKTEDAVTKSSLNNAITAQELYFATNSFYQSCVACSSDDLPGYHDHPKVRLNAETEGDGFILIATHRDCRSGQWMYRSSTKVISSARPFEGCN